MTFRFPRRFTRVAAALGLASVLAPARVRAQAELDLAWSAPPECPTREVVLARLRSLAGDSLRGSRLRAAGRIVPFNGRYRLTLTLRQGDAVRERKMDAVSCDDLAGAAAVTLGLLLRRQPKGGGAAAPESDDGAASDRANGAGAASATSSTSNAEQSSAATTHSQPSVEASKTPEPQKSTEAPSRGETEPSFTAPAAPRRWHVLLRAPAGSVDIGPLPRPITALGAGVGFRYDEWRLLALGRLFESETVSSQALPDLGSRIGRVEGELRGCRDWRRERFELAPCVNFGLSRLTARATGPHVVVQRQHATLFALGAGAEGRVFFWDWLALVAAGTVAIETSRPRFAIADFGEVRELGPVELSIALGAEWIF